MNDWENSNATDAMARQIRQLERQRIRQEIDHYVKGELSDALADKLWVDLLKHPDLFEELQTEVALHRMLSDNIDSDIVERSISKRGI